MHWSRHAHANDAIKFPFPWVQRSHMFARHHHITTSLHATHHHHHHHWHHHHNDKHHKYDHHLNSLLMCDQCDHHHFNTIGPNSNNEQQGLRHIHILSPRYVLFFYYYFFTVLTFIYRKTCLQVWPLSTSTTTSGAGTPEITGQGDDREGLEMLLRWAPGMFFSSFFSFLLNLMLFTSTHSIGIHNTAGPPRWATAITTHGNGGGSSSENGVCSCLGFRLVFYSLSVFFWC